MIDKIVKRLIFLTIMLTPLFTVTEFIAMMQGAYLFTEGTDIRIKLIKDSILSIVIILAFLRMALANKILVPRIFLLIVAIIASYFISIYLNGIYFSFVAIRVFLPLLLAFVSFNIFKNEDYDKLKNTIVFLAVFETIIGVGQLIYGVGGGYSVLGYFKRTIGTFAYPNAFALFMLIANALLLCQQKRSMLENAMIVLFSLLILSSGSGAGIILLGVEYMFKIIFSRRLQKRLKPVIFIALLFTFIMTIIFLPLISGRQGIYSISAASRLNITVEYLSGLSMFELLFGKGLGVGTNTTKYLSDINVMIDSNKTFIADSLYLSLLAQLGFLGFLVFLILNIYLIIISYKNKYQFELLFIIVYLLYNLSGIATEMFPINWIYPIFVGRIFQLYRNKRKGVYL